MGKQALADKLIGILVTSLPKDSAELQVAVDSNDWGKVATVAHRMKGSAANMGAEPLSSAAATLESAARATESAKIAESWFTLQQQIALVLTELGR